MPASLTIRTASLAPRPVQPAIRIRPVPRLEPPTDDDGPHIACGPSDAIPTLPIHFGPPAVGVNRPATMQSLATRAARSQAAKAGRPESPAARAGPPSVAPLIARRFVSTCLEVVGGYRPATHLRPLCSPEQFDRTVRLLTGRRMTGTPPRTLGAARLTAGSSVIGRPTARTPVTGRSPTGAPPRNARADQTSPGGRIDIRKIHVSEPREGVAEVAVVLARQDRVWAMALRLEERTGRWICTALEVL